MSPRRGDRRRAVLPPERWPYGPPDHHEECCVLHEGRDYCDCKASDASDMEHGIGEAPISAFDLETRLAGQRP